MGFIIIILLFSLLQQLIHKVESKYLKDSASINFTNKKSSSPIENINTICKITVAAGGITAPGQPLTDTPEFMAAYFAKYPEDLQRAWANRVEGRVESSLHHNPAFQRRVMEYAQHFNSNTHENIGAEVGPSI